MSSVSHSQFRSTSSLRHRSVLITLKTLHMICRNWLSWSIPSPAQFSFSDYWSWIEAKKHQKSKTLIFGRHMLSPWALMGLMGVEIVSHGTGSSMFCWYLPSRPLTSKSEQAPCSQTRFYQSMLLGYFEHEDWLQKSFYLLPDQCRL